MEQGDPEVPSHLHLPSNHWEGVGGRKGAAKGRGGTFEESGWGLDKGNLIPLMSSIAWVMLINTSPSASAPSAWRREGSKESFQNIPEVKGAPGELERDWGQGMEGQDTGKLLQTDKQQV